MSAGTLIGYARVSTESQDLARQVQALTDAGVEERHLYVEQVSGAQRDRPALEAAVKALRPGDALVAQSLDRLARSLRHLLEVVERVESGGASLRLLDLSLDTSSPSGRLVLHVLGAVAEMERSLIAERTRHAMAARGANRGGRPRALSARQVTEVRRRVEDGQPVSEVAAIYGVSRATVYRAVGTVR